MAAHSIPLPQETPDLASLRRALRVLLVATAAVLTTAGLALLMEYLIRSDAPRWIETAPAPPVYFLPVIPEAIPEPTDRTVVRPPKPERQPPVVKPAEPLGDGFKPIAIEGPTAPSSGPIGPSTGLADGDLMPIVAITPDYPQRAKARGIEGYVTLQFTVNERGRVVSPVVLDAQPAGIFERSALRAVERFRYRPRVVGGKPQPVPAVRTRLRFSLENG